MNKTKALIGFQEAANSLRLYRRAEIVGQADGDSLVEELYVDPLPHDHIFNMVMRPHTTFVIGRKGTGKSTIFQRLQAELRKTEGRTSAYIDIKTVFESSQIDNQLLARLEASNLAMPRESLERLLLYREFVTAVIKEIKSELKKRVDGSLWSRVKEKLSGSYAELFEGLDEILDDLSVDSFVSVLGVRTETIQTKQAEAFERNEKQSIGVSLGKVPELKASDESNGSYKDSSNKDVSYSDILIRTFNVKEILSRLREILAKLDIRHLYVLVDDFSELPEDAMKIAVDVLLAPLNNWSEEFIKFKIAAYPGRIYYGAIDKTKIDEVYLDLYKLYGSSDVSQMEASAIDFTRRLVTRRLEYFCGETPDLGEYFESDTQEVWRLLFFATMANPRILGYILHYLHQNYLINDKKIGPRAIQEAAQLYYEQKIESYFNIGRFLHEVFAERSSLFSLKELLEIIVSRAKELRYHQSDVINHIKGRPPTSHFHVLQGYESLLSTLELNFFITKYYEMSDRDGRRVTIFALNYGLCSKYSIAFGRPQGERKFRLYFVERFFDYSPLLRMYLSQNQEIACDRCGHRFPFEQLEAIRLYKMRCPECLQGTVTVSNLSKKYEQELQQVNENLLLPPTELGILQTLHSEREPLRPVDIAAELDCSYQLVGKRGINLAERNLVERERTPEGNRILKITELAEASYFAEGGVDGLDVPKDPEN